jgi:hypothetical protein
MCVLSLDVGITIEEEKKNVLPMICKHLIHYIYLMANKWKIGIAFLVLVGF